MPNAPRIKQISSRRSDYCRIKCALRDGYAGGMGLPVPVEYAVAVDQYLEWAALSSASRRVYRISLASWAWPFGGKGAPRGTGPGGGGPPVVPLALLDEPATGERL